MFDKKIERFSGSSECFYYDRKTIAKCQESFCAISELIMHYLPPQFKFKIACFIFIFLHVLRTRLAIH